MLFCSMEFGNQYHDTSMMHINQTGGKHLKKAFPGIKPVLTWKAKISQIREINEDTTVSYGRTEKVEKGYLEQVEIIPLKKVTYLKNK